PEPEAWVVLGIRACSRDNVLPRLGRNVTDDLGIDALPHRLAEARFGSFPQRAADLRDGEPSDDSAVQAWVPDSRRVVADEMVDMRQTAARHRRQRDGRQGENRENKGSSNPHPASGPATTDRSSGPEGHGAEEYEAR